MRVLVLAMLQLADLAMDSEAGEQFPINTFRSHMVNIVILDDRKYLVDVGFGAEGPFHPIPMISGLEIPGIHPQLLGLEYKSLPMHTDPHQRAWVFSQKSLSDDAWTEAYAFTEIEWFPEDFAVINLRPMTSPDSIFKQAVICMKALLNPDTGELEGTITLFENEVKQKIRGVVVKSEKFTSEAERVEGLEKWFDIRLTQEERVGIKGLPSELVG